MRVCLLGWFCSDLPGRDIIEKKFCRFRLDWIRRLLTYEPRGSSNSYGALITEPLRPGASFGALFLTLVVGTICVVMYRWVLLLCC